MVSHATGDGSGQPTPAQLKELFAQIESGKVNKGRLQEFLRSPSTPVVWAKAQGIMGKRNFFGPMDWKRFFGKKFQIATVPEIPWSQSELESPEINQEHFLFLGLDRLDGKLLNLPAWHRVYSGESHPKFYWDWYLTHKFAQAPCVLRWYLMPVGIVEGSRSLSYDRQVAMLPDEYEVPTATARVTANVLYYLLNKKYLDTDYWARTSDKSDGGHRVVVRGGSVFGLFVYDWLGGVSSYVGVSASRKS